MSDFPPINDEFRPRARLKRHQDGPATDAEIEANSRAIGEKWGAATHIPPPEAPSAPLAPVTSIRGYIPDHGDDLRQILIQRPPWEALRFGVTPGAELEAQTAAVRGAC
jgi:hypothetical protein